VDGLSNSGYANNSIVAYAGQSGARLWTLPLPETDTDGSARIDSSGTILKYTIGSKKAFLRDLPYHGGVDVATDIDETLALGRRFVFLHCAAGEPGLKVARPGSPEPLIKLEPDAPVHSTEARFSPDGRFLIWGLETGTIKVADLPRVREQLMSVGFPGW
jgi:hypothetical protein